MTDDDDQVPGRCAAKRTGYLFLFGGQTGKGPGLGGGGQTGKRQFPRKFSWLNARPGKTGKSMYVFRVLMKFPEILHAFLKDDDDDQVPVHCAAQQTRLSPIYLSTYLVDSYLFVHTYIAEIQRGRTKTWRWRPDRKRTGTWRWRPDRKGPGLGGGGQRKRTGSSIPESYRG